MSDNIFDTLFNNNKEEKETNPTDMALAIGSFVLLCPKFISMSMLTPFIPHITLGGIVAGSLFGVYRTLTHDKREYLKMIEEKRTEWNEFWMGVGIKNKMNDIPILVNIWKHDYGKVYSFINPLGICSKTYENIELTLCEYLSIDSIEIEVKEGFVNIKAIEIKMPDVIPFILPKKSDDIIIKLGLNEKGKDTFINLTNVHSWLIAGATGSGKSICIHTILTQLYANYSDECDFYICDMKKVELSNYKSHKKTIEYIDSSERVEQLIDNLLEECDKRHQLFIEHKVKNLKQYNKKVNKKDRLPNIVLCMEEVVRLMGNKQIQSKLAELCFIARSAGFIIIMSIQRCTRNLLSGDIKSSLLGKIGFKTVNRVNSQVILDDDRLFYIKNVGECYISCDDISIGEQKVKVMYLDENRIDKIIGAK